MELLVGQTAVINLQMAPSTVQETVTVTAETPLIETTTSSLGGNIDPRQVQELPVNGRNWMALALLAPGSRTSSTNAVTPLPDRNGGEAREFQLNLDGQQVSADIGVGGQPKYSQDSIAGISVHLEPVRRDDGPVDRRAGERDHQVGQQPAHGPVPRQLPQQPLQRRRIRS